MNEFMRSNKIRGIRWLKYPIHNLNIRIKLKAEGSILCLPKFEDYANGITNINLEENIEEYVFKWQEKRFNLWGLKHYGELHNCATDLDLNYYDLIKNGSEGQKVFSYIHDDHFALPFSKITQTESWLDKANAKIQSVFSHDTVSMSHLFRSQENICKDEEQWTAMHIVFDNSTYNEDSELLVKQEVVLLSLYHNTSKDYLIVSPDVNDLEMNPYTIELDNGMILDYQYSIDLINDSEEDDNELILLLEKLSSKWTKKHNSLLNFILPPNGKKNFYIRIEIVTARKFDMDNIYIDYNIKIPEGVVSKDLQNGRTHISESITNDDVPMWNFGHTLDLSLEVDNNFESKSIRIFFEVISTDWWGRHRTEGYTHLSLPLLSGEDSRTLVCLRPEVETLSEDSRRFFIGGCHLLKDLDVLIQPEKDPSIIYQTTGDLSVRWSIISQSSSPQRTFPTPSTSDGSSLLVGADAALKQYRKARAKLKAATRDLEAGDG